MLGLSRFDRDSQVDIVSRALARCVPTGHLSRYTSEFRSGPTSSTRGHMHGVPVPETDHTPTPPIQSIAFPTRNRSLRSRPPRSRPIPTPFLEDCWFPRQLRGRALEVLKNHSPSMYGIDLEDGYIPIGEEIYIWGRPWLVRQSSFAGGLGLFACVDIHVAPDCLEVDLPELFPFHGPSYSLSSWSILSRACKTYPRYGLLCARTPETRMIDGYPERTGNIAGYINSSIGPSGAYLGEANAEWVEGLGPHRMMDTRIRHHVITVATRTIRRGDEILISYEWDPLWTYSSWA